jgi:S-adenosylmethionine:tRNA ribosyltransferase-isomerase
LKTQAIAIEDYNYDLPDERIAKFPLDKRDESKLLVFDGKEIKDRRFKEIGEILPPESLLVFNNTKVIPARLFFKRATGALIQAFLLHPTSHNGIITQVMEEDNTCQWECMIGNKKKWKGEKLTAMIHLNGKDITLLAEVINSEKNEVRFYWDQKVSFAELVKAFGEIPLPPYLNRNTEEKDKETYQTVYSKSDGAVAAPTAGLHFTDVVLEDLKQKGFKQSFLTLHVGAGTFQPVKVENAMEHHMHSEQIVVSKSFIKDIILHDLKIIPVGTTSMRSLESLYWFGVMLSIKPNSQFKVEKLFPYEYDGREITRKEAFQNILTYLNEKDIETLIGSTEIFIFPGYKMRVCDGIITNFHQPKSTLLLLISALIGEKWRDVYHHAMKNDYRFLSYGDSSFLTG